MCKCRSDIEQRLKDQVAEQKSNATDVRAELGGYVFLLGDELTTAFTVPATVTYEAPKKGGGRKTVKEKLSIRARFCPFCGEDTVAAAEAAQ